MRTLLRMITSIALSALCASAAMANKAADTCDFVINGIILNESGESKAKCTLELFYENTLVETSQIKMDKYFERKLKKNVWYTIRITKEGYVPLLISFNTQLKNGAEVLDNLFEFETALIDLKSAQYMNKEQMEFPVGIVAYNEVSKKFEASDVYTTNYMAALNNTPPANGSGVAVAAVYHLAKQNEADIAKEYISKRNMAEGMC